MDTLSTALAALFGALFLARFVWILTPRRGDAGPGPYCGEVSGWASAWDGPDEDGPGRDGPGPGHTST